MISSSGSPPPAGSGGVAEGLVAQLDAVADGGEVLLGAGRWEPGSVLRVDTCAVTSCGYVRVDVRMG